ncbi:MAG: hypothetical protein MZV64_14735 [Ignavibacteriales bacterium]|nr:hypothetical protein [Ignavibacteriales bacterium]
MSISDRQAGHGGPAGLAGVLHGRGAPTPDGNFGKARYVPARHGPEAAGRSSSPGRTTRPSGPRRTGVGAPAADHRSLREPRSPRKVE